MNNVNEIISGTCYTEVFSSNMDKLFSRISSRVDNKVSDVLNEDDWLTKSIYITV